MITIEQAYDELAYHSKEAAKLPFTFDTMTVDQQLFFRDLFNEIMYNKQEQEELHENHTEIDGDDSNLEDEEDEQDEELEYNYFIE